MALDGFVISNIVYELNQTILNAKISKIAQPENDELLFTCKGSNGQFRLAMSASASLPFLGPGLVGTNHCNGSHRLACMHLAHQVVGGEHATHIQRQTECHAHRQAFGHSHHNQGNRHHKVLQSSLQGRQPITEGVE